MPRFSANTISFLRQVVEHYSMSLVSIMLLRLCFRFAKISAIMRWTSKLWNLRKLCIVLCVNCALLCDSDSSSNCYWYVTAKAAKRVRERLTLFAVHYLLPSSAYWTQHAVTDVVHGSNQPLFLKTISFYDEDPLTMACKLKFTVYRCKKPSTAFVSNNYVKWCFTLIVSKYFQNSNVCGIY